MQRALEALGISQELIDRLKKVTRERKQAVVNFAEIEWEKVVGSWLCPFPACAAHSACGRACLRICFLRQ